MATTTNYGWETPDDTDLVKDGAAAIRTLGSSIDTTTKNLNPSTTLGDIEYRSATANTNTRLGIGTSGQVLTVSAGVPAWTTISSGGWTSLASGNFNTAAATLNLTSISTDYQQLILILKDVSPVTTTGNLILKLNNDSTNYANSSTSTGSGSSTADSTQINVGSNIHPSSTDSLFIITLTNYANTTAHKIIKYETMYQSGATTWGFYNGIAAYRSTSAITQINLSNSAATNWAAGTYDLFGVK